MKLADKVRLNSGGPEMMINEKRDDEWICVWFDGCKLKSESFPELALTLVNKKEIDDVKVTEKKLDLLREKQHHQNTINTLQNVNITDFDYSDYTCRELEDSEKLEIKEMFIKARKRRIENIINELNNL